MTDLATRPVKGAIKLPANSGLAAARAAELDALADPDPWTRSDALAAQWLRSYASAGTRDRYRETYAAWRVFCEALGAAPLEASRTDVETFARALEMSGNPAAVKPRPLGSASVARHLAALSAYYNRALDEGMVDRSPTTRVARPRVSDESGQPNLSRDDERRLLDAADRHSARSAALVALLALACLRVSEALAIRVEHLSESDGHRTVRVRRKGGKHRQVPLAPAVWRRVEAYAADRESGYLFVTGAGERMDRHHAWETIGMLAKRAGIAARVGPHTLRHAYLTRGHEMGLPLADLQDAAGHADPRTTRRYDRTRYSLDRHPSYAIARDVLTGAEEPAQEAADGA